jgi:hypothetical protein
MRDDGGEAAQAGAYPGSDDGPRGNPAGRGMFRDADAGASESWAIHRP